MIKLEFFFGVGGGLSPWDIAAGKQALLKHVAYLAGGCSLLSHTGAWMNPESSLVTFPGYTLVVLTANPALAPGIAAFIKVAFSQKSVLVIQSEVSSSFH